MAPKFRRFLVAVMTVAASLGATSAEAAPEYQQFYTGNLGLTCDLPGIGDYPVDASAYLEGPSSVAAGETVQFSALTAHVVIPREIVQVYQGIVEGFRATDGLTIGVQGGTPSAISMTVASPYQMLPVPPDYLVLTAYQAPGTTIPAITAAGTGQVLTVSIDAFMVTLDVNLGPGSPVLQSPCVLNASQYTAFSPSLIIL
ncbi:DUF6801 domain-containing protein [Amycolatopsis lurida]